MGHFFFKDEFLKNNEQSKRVLSNDFSNEALN